MTNSVRRLVQEQVRRLPPPEMDRLAWDQAVRQALAGTSTPEQFVKVFGTQLWSGRRTCLGLAPVFIALRRAGLDNVSEVLSLVAFPPDEAPPGDHLLVLAGAFAWMRRSRTEMDEYACRTGLDFEQVSHMRREGLGLALIVHDEAGAYLRRRVWHDGGGYWWPSSEVRDLAANTVIGADWALELIDGAWPARDLLADTGVLTTVNQQDEWKSLDLAVLIDNAHQHHGGHGTWSDPVEKGQPIFPDRGSSTPT